MVMNDIFLKDLRLHEIDVDGALDRLSGDKELYIELLVALLKDPTMLELEMALENKAWDDAFTAAHALKGVTGNLGFTLIFHSLGELVILIRAGRVDEIDKSFNYIKQCYSDIIRVIDSHCK